jgi:hypothetical protein
MRLLDLGGGQRGSAHLQPTGVLAECKVEGCGGASICAHGRVRSVCKVEGGGAARSVPTAGSAVCARWRAAGRLDLRPRPCAQCVQGGGVRGRVDLCPIGSDDAHRASYWRSVRWRLVPPSSRGGPSCEARAPRAADRVVALPPPAPAEGTPPPRPPPPPPPSLCERDRAMARATCASSSSSSPSPSPPAESRAAAPRPLAALPRPSACRRRLPALLATLSELGLSPVPGMAGRPDSAGGAPPAKSAPSGDRSCRKPMLSARVVKGGGMDGVPPPAAAAASRQGAGWGGT